MNKFEQFKEAIKNPPPERLAKVEYQSHLMQGMGIIFVSIILIYKGYWYILFAFVFGLGISYAQGMTAYNRYKAILSIIQNRSTEDIDKEISFTRKRSKIIQSVFPSARMWVSGISVVLAYFLLGRGLELWQRIVLYPMVIFFNFIVLYFFIAYFIVLLFYKKDIVERRKKKNVQKEKK